MWTIMEEEEQGESCTLRNQQGMPRMSKIAGGRVKLQTSQAKSNEVACAKLQHQAMSELLPWSGVGQANPNCVWAFRSFSDISVSRCCFSGFGSCWRWDNFRSNADSHWCFFLEGCKVLFFLTFQMKCPWNVSQCDTVMKRIYSRPAWNVYEETMTSKERRKESRQSCKWVKI